MRKNLFSYQMSEKCWKNGRWASIFPAFFTHLVVFQGVGWGRGNKKPSSNQRVGQRVWLDKGEATLLISITRRPAKTFA
jgi:hypothetical protein